MSFRQYVKAKDQQGNPIHALKDSPKKGKGHYVCVGCEKEVIFRCGDKNIPHFSHTYLGECNHDEEANILNEAKNYLVKAKKLFFNCPINKTPQEISTHFAVRDTNFYVNDDAELTTNPQNNIVKIKPDVCFFGEDGYPSFFVFFYFVAHGDTSINSKRQKWKEIFTFGVATLAIALDKYSDESIENQILNKNNQQFIYYHGNKYLKLNHTETERQIASTPYRSLDIGQLCKVTIVELFEAIERQTNNCEAAKQIEQSINEYQEQLQRIAEVRRVDDLITDTFYEIQDTERLANETAKRLVERDNGCVSRKYGTTSKKIMEGILSNTQRIEAIRGSDDFIRIEQAISRTQQAISRTKKAISNEQQRIEQSAINQHTNELRARVRAAFRPIFSARENRLRNVVFQDYTNTALNVLPPEKAAVAIRKMRTAIQAFELKSLQQ